MTSRNNLLIAVVRVAVSFFYAFFLFLSRVLMFRCRRTWHVCYPRKNNHNQSKMKPISKWSCALFVCLSRRRKWRRLVDWHDLPWRNWSLTYAPRILIDRWFERRALFAISRKMHRWDFGPLSPPTVRRRFSSTPTTRTTYVLWSIDRSIDWSIDRLIDWLIDCLIDWLFDWLIDCSFVRLIDWLIGWLMGFWLIDRMIG